jgi:hypothetical protein
MKDHKWKDIKATTTFLITVVFRFLQLLTHYRYHCYYDRFVHNCIKYKQGESTNVWRKHIQHNQTERRAVEYCMYI